MADEEEENVVDLSSFDTGEEGAEEAGDAPAADGDLQAKLEKAEKDFMYLRADFENFKKTSIKERSQLVKYGNERLLVDLLGVLDNFEHALNMELTADNVDSFRDGIELIKTELYNSLSKYGLVKVDSKGQAFDPNVHEALSSEPTSEVEPGHISQVFKDAYKLHDRIIRPAQVVVATEAEEAPAADEEPPAPESAEDQE